MATAEEKIETNQEDDNSKEFEFYSKLHESKYKEYDVDETNKFFMLDSKIKRKYYFINFDNYDTSKIQDLKNETVGKSIVYSHGFSKLPFDKKRSRELVEDRLNEFNHNVFILENEFYARKDDKTYVYTNNLHDFLVSLECCYVINIGSINEAEKNQKDEIKELKEDEDWLDNFTDEYFDGERLKHYFDNAAFDTELEYILKTVEDGAKGVKNREYVIKMLKYAIANKEKESKTCVEFKKVLSSNYAEVLESFSKICDTPEKTKEHFYICLKRFCDLGFGINKIKSQEFLRFVEKFNEVAETQKIRFENIKKTCQAWVHLNDQADELCDLIEQMDSYCKDYQKKMLFVFEKLPHLEKCMENEYIQELEFTHEKVTMAVKAIHDLRDRQVKEKREEREKRKKQREIKESIREYQTMEYDPEFFEDYDESNEYIESGPKSMFFEPSIDEDDKIINEPEIKKDEIKSKRKETKNKEVKNKAEKEMEKEIKIKTEQKKNKFVNESTKELKEQKTTPLVKSDDNDSDDEIMSLISKVKDEIDGKREKVRKLKDEKLTKQNLEKISKTKDEIKFQKEVLVKLVKKAKKSLSKERNVSSLSEQKDTETNSDIPLVKLIQPKV